MSWPIFFFVSSSGNITLGGDNIIDPSSLRNQIVNQDFNLTSDVVDWLLNATLNRRVITILLNKSLAQVLLSYPGLNEYKIFYLV